MNQSIYKICDVNWGDYKYKLAWFDLNLVLELEKNCIIYKTNLVFRCVFFSCVILVRFGCVCKIKTDIYEFWRGSYKEWEDKEEHDSRLLCHLSRFAKKIKKKNIYFFTKILYLFFLILLCAWWETNNLVDWDVR